MLCVTFCRNIYYREISLKYTVENLSGMGKQFEATMTLQTKAETFINIMKIAAGMSDIFR